MLGRGVLVAVVVAVVAAAPYEILKPGELMNEVVETQTVSSTIIPPTDPAPVIADTPIKDFVTVGEGYAAAPEPAVPEAPTMSKADMMVMSAQAKQIDNGHTPKEACDRCKASNCKYTCYHTQPTLEMTKLYSWACPETAPPQPSADNMGLTPWVECE